MSLSIVPQHRSSRLNRDDDAAPQVERPFGAFRALDLNVLHAITEPIRVSRLASLERNGDGFAGVRNLCHSTFQFHILPFPAFISLMMIFFVWVSRLLGRQSGAAECQAGAGSRPAEQECSAPLAATGPDCALLDGRRGRTLHHLVDSSWALALCRRNSRTVSAMLGTIHAGELGAPLPNVTSPRAGHVASFAALRGGVSVSRSHGFTPGTCGITAWQTLSRGERRALNRG